MDTLGLHNAMLLGLREDWQVKSVDLDVAALRVEIRLVHTHQSSCRCPECGVRNVHIPWAAPHGRLTLLFEAFAVQVLQAASNIEQGRQLIGLSWGAAQSIMGYVPASKAGAELLFDVIATAYERHSLIMTTNLPFENWPEVLGSERLTGAALDRLNHRCPPRTQHGWKPRARVIGCWMPGGAANLADAGLMSNVSLKLRPRLGPWHVQALPEPCRVTIPRPRAAIFDRPAPPVSTGLNTGNQRIAPPNAVSPPPPKKIFCTPLTSLADCITVVLQ